MDAEGNSGTGRQCGLHACGDLQGQAAAIGVAKDDRGGPRGSGGFQRLEGVVGIGLPSVEKMLGIVEDLPTLPFAVGHRVGDHREVFLERGADNLVDMQVPGFADDGDEPGVGGEKRLESGVLGGADALLACHAKGGNPGILEGNRLEGLEELGILGVGKGVAPLDEIDAQIIEPAENGQLVLNGKVNSLALAAVAQGCVVQVHPGHDDPPPLLPAPVPANHRFFGPFGENPMLAAGAKIC